MARPNFPCSINRRSLITSAAAVTAAGFVPVAGPCNADPVRIVEALPPQSITPKVPALNVSATTARRLLEIKRRNEIRREAGLPILSIPKELRRMRRQEELEAFGRFEAAHCAAVWEQVLEPRREAEGPKSRLRWIESVWYQKQVREILRRHFKEASHGRKRPGPVGDQQHCQEVGACTNAENLVSRKATQVLPLCA